MNIGADGLSMTVDDMRKYVINILRRRQTDADVVVYHAQLKWTYEVLVDSDTSYATDIIYDAFAKENRVHIDQPMCPNFT